MTHFQRLLNAFGFWRFKRYRCWVGGRWAERYIEPTGHSLKCPRWRWELDPGAQCDAATHMIEQWSIRLPPAHMKATTKKMKPLPKEWRGAEVLHGNGMKSDDLDTFLGEKAMDGFDAKREMWIVVEDKALDDLDGLVEIKGFADKNDAIRFAQARAHGNVDQRVLRVTDQVLVVGTNRDR